VILRDALGEETTWVEGTQYDLTGGAGALGTVTVKTTPTDYTPATGETLLIRSNREDKQSTSFPLGGSFPSTSAEQANDQSVRLIQQRTEEVARTFKVSKTVTDNPNLEITELAAGRADKVVGFDSSGDIAVKEISDLTTNATLSLSGTTLTITTA